jgi:hypothetical protein
MFIKCNNTRWSLYQKGGMNIKGSSLLHFCHYADINTRQVIPSNISDHSIFIVELCDINISQLLINVGPGVA